MKKLDLYSNIINEQQRKVFRLVLLLTVLCGIYFVMLNWMKGAYIVAGIELVMALFSLFLLLKLPKVKDYHLFRKISGVYITLFFTIMLFSMGQKHISDNIFVWMYLIPVLSYFLLGNLGIYFSLVYAGIAFSTILIKYNFFDLSLVHIISLSNISVSLLIIWLISHSYEQANILIKRKLSKISVTDPLTNTYNRQILQEIRKTYDEEHPLSLCVLDIDHFKAVNDTYGHDAGDAVLRSFALALKNAFGDIAYVIRLGGEEFGVCFPYKECADIQPLIADFLIKMNNTAIDYENISITITFSAGIAEYPKETAEFSELLKIADHRLYKAKKLGRNQIVVAEPKN